ncbi:hypothetical protein AAE478_006289 [Parahypoxylon ruwenzoriense]
MANLAILYPLLFIAAAAVAIYVQISSSTLSLPLSTGTTVLTILLPFLAAANVFCTPLLRRLLLARLGSSSSSPASLLRLVPAALQLIQGVLTIVLATLAAEGFTPGQVLECSLEGNWQHLWRAHDDRAIERIQNAFDCCGFRSTVDRDYPRGHCVEYTHRNSACIGPWRASMQRTAGLEFSVAIVVGILQVVHLALFKLRNSGGGSARAGYRRITQSIGANPSEGLLADGVVDADHDETEGAGDGPGNGHHNYGALESGPNHRLEPSGLGEERNNWS